MESHMHLCFLIGINLCSDETGPIYYDHFSVMKTLLETSVLLHQIYYSDSRLEPTIISFEESRIEKSLKKSSF